MENRTSTIENGIVHIPNRTRMSILEIANLFDIFYQTARREIRAIEKSGIASGDALSCTAEGQTICPDYYGLEMVIAVAFRVQTLNTKVFRKWIIREVLKTEASEKLIMFIQNPILN